MRSQRCSGFTAIHKAVCHTHKCSGIDMLVMPGRRGRSTHSGDTWDLLGYRTLLWRRLEQQKLALANFPSAQQQLLTHQAPTWLLLLCLLTPAAAVACASRRHTCLWRGQSSCWCWGQQ
jgi:hypothetical protein